MRHRTRSLPVLLAVLAALIAVAPAAARDKQFDSPSGNIRCILQDGASYKDTGWAVRCQTQSPARSVAMGPDAYKTCKGKRCLGVGLQASIYRLAYGDTYGNRYVICTSLETGIECRLKASGDGFLISKSGVSRFR